MWSSAMKLSACATRSALEWEMSRSCQRATLSKATCAFAFTTRERPQTFSTVMGLRLWGMAELPFWPLRKGSSASRVSVFWRLRISVAMRSHVAAVVARTPAR